jgi:uncharacterized protein YutE (UPF0331/DUF86 family)
MVSVEKITDKLGRLDEFRSVLQGMHGISLDAFLKDKILIGIECCLDIANHIISAERFRAPSDYADSFKVLEEQGIVTAEFGLKLRQMAKFRNRLVHLYGEIDDAYVHEFIRKDLQDFISFKKVVADKYFPCAVSLAP